MKHCHFNDWTVDHWHDVGQTTNAWWADELDRPLASVIVSDKPTSPMPAPKPFGRGLFADLTVSQEQMVDQLAWELGRQTYEYTSGSVRSKVTVGAVRRVSCWSGRDGPAPRGAARA